MKLFKYVKFRKEFEQNHTCKQKVGHCEKNYATEFFVFTILNTYVPLIFHAKIQLKYLVAPEKKFIWLFFASFSNSGHPGCSI